MILNRHKPLHLVLLMFFILVTTYIISSAVSASTKLENLIVIVPAGVLAIILCVFVLVFIPDRESDNQSNKNKEDSDSNQLTKVDLLFILAYGIFCFALVYVGFDIATFAFIWIGTLLAGAKSKVVSLIYALITTALIVYTFKTLLPYPFPLLILS